MPTTLRSVRRLAVWAIEGAHRRERLVRRLFLLEDTGDPAYVLEVSLSPSGAKSVLAMSDGTVLAIDVKTGKTTRFQRIPPSRISHGDSRARLAIDFDSGLVVVLDADGAQLFDFDGRPRGAIGQANGAIEHEGGLYLLDGADVSDVDSDGKRRAVGCAKARIVAATSCSLLHGLERRNDLRRRREAADG